MSRSVAWACLLSYGLLLACPASAAGEPQPALTAAEAEALVREVSAAVEKLRHLKFKTPVKMQIIDGATARENFKAKVQPVEEAGITNTQHAYAQLGLIPPTTNLLSDYYHLAEKGVLSKETHETVVRLAPPLMIARADLDWALDSLAEVLAEVAVTREPVAA